MIRTSMPSTVPAHPGWPAALCTALAGVLMALSSNTQADELLTLQTRPGVEVKVMVLEPKGPPKGVLIAYVGGDGTLGLGTLLGRPVIGNTDYEKAFLVRNRERFVQAGYALLLPDVPSDRKMLHYLYRLGEQQADDAAPVIDWAKQRYGKAPWLLGTSASALTVGNVGSRPDVAIGGIVLIRSGTAVHTSHRA